MVDFADISELFRDVKYVARRTPGVENQNDLTLGANCQVYAYEFLRHHGKSAPNLRSSELWSDTTYTEVAEQPELLDIMLYNKTPDAYGAHVGVYIGDGKVLHLAQSIGKPEIAEHTELMTRPLYHCFIGAKRVVHNAS